jgi:hypothetical protein
MKNIQLTIAILLFTVTTSFVYADFTDMYGTYESIMLRDMYATKKNITPEQKESFERMRVSITINENKVIMVLGSTNEEPLKMNYYIIKKDFILAYFDELINVMYYPIYFKNNIIYTMGQSFEKK